MIILVIWVIWDLRNCLKIRNLHFGCSLCVNFIRNCDMNSKFEDSSVCQKVLGLLGSLKLHNLDLEIVSPQSMYYECN